MKITIGIDIGINGAIAALDADVNKVLEIVPIPTIPMELLAKKRDGTAKVRNVYDRLGLVLALARFRHLPAGRRYACIERPITMPAQTILTTASMFEGFGLIQGILIGMGIDHGSVMPVTWTKALLGKIKQQRGESDYHFKKRKKARSIDKAIELFPDAGEMIGNNDNFADAVLIAKWSMDSRKKEEN